MDSRSGSAASLAAAAAEMRRKFDGLDALCASDTGNVGMLIADVGLGKTRVAVQQMASGLRREGRRFLSLSHEQIEERKEEFAALGGLEVVHEKGVALLCPRAATNRDFKEVLLSLARRGWNARGDLCPDCGSRPSCPAFGSFPKDGIHFAPHALPVGAPDDNKVVIVDEHFALVRTERIEVEDFGTILSPTLYPMLAEWKANREDLARIAVRAAALAVEEVRAFGARLGDQRQMRFPTRVAGAWLARLLPKAAASVYGVEDGDAALFETEGAWRERGGPTRPPKPPSNRLADGTMDPRLWPRGDMDDVFDALLRAGVIGIVRATRVAPLQPLRWLPPRPVGGTGAAPLRLIGPQACIVVRLADPDAGQPDPEVWFEIRKPTVTKLLRERSVIVLDATGDFALPEWQAVVGRERLFVERVSVGEPADVAVRTWKKTRSFTRGSLFGRLDRRRLSDRGSRAVASALREAIPLDAEAASVGVVTHKPLAKILRWAQRVIEGQDADGTAAARLYEKNGGRVLAMLRALYEDGSLGKLVVGHYGKMRGTNQFNDVEVLVLLGDPIPDISATREDARAFGLDDQLLVDARTQSEVVQALGRARTIRRTPERPVQFYYAGRIEPFGWSDYRLLETPANRPVTAAGEAARELARLLWREVGVATWRFVRNLATTPEFADRVIFVVTANSNSSYSTYDAKPDGGLAGELRRLAVEAARLADVTLRRAFLAALPANAIWVSMIPPDRIGAGRPWRVCEAAPGLAEKLFRALGGEAAPERDREGSPRQDAGDRPAAERRGDEAQE